MRKRAVSKREAKINAFYKFLIAENAFVEYREAVRRCKICTLTTAFNHPIQQWISCTFLWGSTNFNYWLDMCTKWDEYRRVNKIT